MSDPVADSVLDEVMVLGIELAAVAKPRDPTKFVALLQRFAHAIIREAFEHQDEIRARLGMPRAQAHDVELIERLKAGERACPYCGTQVATMVGHECERMRELGFVDGAVPRVNDNSSTGAAEAETKAAQRETNLAPTAETPAAPSIAFTREPIAEPASSSPQTPLSGAAEDGAGAPAAGPGAGAQGSQRGAPAALTADQHAELMRAYGAVRAANGGQTPRGWVQTQAEKLGVSVRTIYRELEGEMIEALTDKVSGERPAPTTNANGGSKRLTPEQREQLYRKYRAARPNGAPLPDGWMVARAAECGVAYHTAYNALLPIKVELDKLQKGRGRQAAVLSTPTPRADRFKVRRMQGTYGGGS
jgi:hypothetical protein